jgi:hypothetical protein
MCLAAGITDTRYVPCDFLFYTTFVVVLGPSGLPSLCALFLVRFIWTVSWIGHILRINCLIKHGIEGKIEGTKEVTGRLGRRR